MSKLTKFKVRRSQFPLDFRIDDTTRNANIKTLVAMPGTVFEEGTEETAETYNGLQLGLVHSVIPVKSVANSIDYYTCDIEGIADFGMHNELKLQMKITATNEYDQPKIKMAGNDYQIMRFDGVQLTQVLAGQLKKDNIYNLSFNGTFFMLSSGMIAEKEIKAMLDDLKKNIFENMHPVGSIYTTTSTGFDPNAIFGGLWERYAQGRTLIGVSDNDPAFSNAGLTGGTKTKALALTNLPAHTHTATFAGTAVGNHTHTVDNHTHLVPDHNHQVFLSSWAESGGTPGHMASGGNTRESVSFLMDGYAQGGSVWTQGSQPGTSDSGAHTPSGSVTVESTGEGIEFDILNPYITVYFWKRVR